jgi:hypothetical protein
MSAEFCKRPGCGHHRDDHANIPHDDGACMVGVRQGKPCSCREYLAYTHGGQRGSEAGCYS